MNAKKRAQGFGYILVMVLFLLGSWVIYAYGINYDGLGDIPGSIRGVPEPVHVDGGLVTGTPAWGWGVQEFRGIPYAAPPVGDLRWRSPQPVVPWKGVLSADHFGARCMQPLQGGNPRPAGVGNIGPLWDDPGTVRTSENCLFLNIWTPAATVHDNLPVIIFFHGGGGTFGEGSEAIFDGSMVAKKGVIWVTANYRLGVFGNLALPALVAESKHHTSGNYFELDKLAAIRWVKNNIANFGGDPNNITIMGHSSGSRSINNVVASPLAKGLFQRAIAQSHTSYGRMMTLGEAEALGTKFVQSMGNPSVADLRNMSAEKLLKIATTSGNRELVYGDAKIDGYFLPTDVYTIFNEKKENDVSLLSGSTNDEHGIGENLNSWRFYLQLPGHPPKTVAEYDAWAHKAFGDQADRFLKVYPAHNDADVARDVHNVGRDAILQGQRVWAQYQAKDGTHNAYLYLFSHKPPVPKTAGRQLPIPGAIHGSEFFYVLDNLHIRDLPWTSTDRKVANIASSYWTNFAKTGNPNGPGLPNWPAYKASTDMLMNISSNPHAEPVPDKAGLSFLSFWDQHFRSMEPGGEAAGDPPAH